MVDSSQRQTITVREVHAKYPEIAQADLMLRSMTSAIADLNKRTDISTADVVALQALRAYGERIANHQELSGQMEKVQGQIDKLNQKQNDLSEIDQAVKAMLERALVQLQTAEPKTDAQSKTNLVSPVDTETGAPTLAMDLAQRREQELLAAQQRGIRNSPIPTDEVPATEQDKPPVQ